MARHEGERVAAQQRQCWARTAAPGATSGQCGAGGCASAPLACPIDPAAASAESACTLRERNSGSIALTEAGILLPAVHASVASP